jgi:hypothetical protein
LSNYAHSESGEEIMKIPVPDRDSLSLLLMMFALSIASSCSYVSSHAKQSKGEVGYATITPPESSALVLATNQAFVLGEPIPSVTMPTYPKALLSSGLPDQRICVSVVVTEEGYVASVIPLFAIPDCPLTESETNEEFVTSVIDAVSRWEFFSSQTCTFPAGAAENNRCSGAGVVLLPVAVTQSFQFLFSIKSGVGVVSQVRRKS